MERHAQQNCSKHRPGVTGKVQLFTKEYLRGIGRSIGPCCYEVGTEIISKITSNSDVYEGYMGAVISENKGFFNLWEANKRQLMQMGIPERNIEVAQICTRCNHDRFFSYRYQQKETGGLGRGLCLMAYN